MLLDARRRGLRRRRRDPPRRSRRGGLARAQRAQHLLPAVAARRSSAGPASRIASPRRARGSRICCGCRAGGCRSRRSRSRTMRSCRRRRCSRRSTPPGCRSSGWCSRRARGPARGCSCTRRWRSIRSCRRWSAARRPTGWRCDRRAASTDAAVPRPDRSARAPSTYAVSQRRALPRVPVQVLRRARPQAAGGARRGGLDDAAGARPFRPRRVRELLRGVAAARARRDHDGERRATRSRCSTRSPSSISRRCRRGIARSSGRCSSGSAAAAGLRRARLRLRDRGRHRRSSSGCSSISSKDTFTFAADGGTAAE